MAAARQLALVPPPATRKQILTEALEALAMAEADAQRLREIIATEGRALWHERNPGQKLFGHLRIEQIKQMVAEQ